MPFTKKEHRCQRDEQKQRHAAGGERGYAIDPRIVHLGRGDQAIRRELASVKHQDLAGSNIGDDHKEYFLGEKALLAGGAANTMNQF